MAEVIGSTKSMHTIESGFPAYLADQFQKLAGESAAVINQVLSRTNSEPGLDCTAEVVSAFKALSRERQVHIVNDLKAFLLLASDIKLLPSRADANFEKEFLLRFLAKTGFKLPGNDFLDRIADGDLIEVYDSNCTQIYRSWSLFNVCSYSLAELLVYPFDVLYERPSWILGRLMELVPEALSPNCPIIDFQLAGVGEYTLRETFKGHHFVNNFRMKYCTGLLGAHSRQPEAFVTTGSARLIETVPLKSGLAFI